MRKRFQLCLDDSDCTSMGQDKACVSMYFTLYERDRWFFASFSFIFENIESYESWSESCETAIQRYCYSSALDENSRTARRR